MKVKWLFLILILVFTFFGFYFASAANFGPAFVTGNENGYIECNSQDSIDCYLHFASPGSSQTLTHQTYSAEFYTSIMQKFGNSAYLRVQNCLTESGWLAGNIADCRTTIDRNIWNDSDPQYYGQNNLVLGPMEDLNYLSLHIWVNNVYTRTFVTSVGGRRVFINNLDAPSSLGLGQSYDIAFAIDNMVNNANFNYNSSLLSCNVFDGQQVAGNTGINSVNCSAIGVGNANVSVTATGPGGFGPETVTETQTISIAAGGGAINLNGSCTVVNGSTNRSNLSWNSLAGSSNYTIQEHVWSTGGWYDVATITGTSYSRDVPNNADFYYRVIANPSGTISTPGDLFICGTSAPPVTCNGGLDVGLRLYQDGVRKLAVEPGSPTSPLRVYKDGVRGVVLVDTTDPNASRMRIQTSAGIKATCILP